MLPPKEGITASAHIEAREARPDANVAPPQPPPALAIRCHPSNGSLSEPEVEEDASLGHVDLWSAHVQYHTPLAFNCRSFQSGG